MQATDARMLRGAALPTAAAGGVAVILSTVFAGTKGLIGALVGAALVIAFFSVSLLVLSYAARKMPQQLFGIAMLTYIGKILILGIFLAVFRDTTLFDTKAFAWTIVACTLVWLLAGMLVFRRLQILYVEPSSSAGTGKS